MTGLADRSNLTAALPALALRGTVVTSGPAGVLPSATVYVQNRRIVDVRPSTESAPPGFPTTAPVVDTHAVIYPGLVDLHNHLPYNVLPRWVAPRRFVNRDEWRASPEYDQHVKEPMSVLNAVAPLRKAIVRYIEVKLLMGGVTSGQGMSKEDAAFYKGLVRNFEAPDDPGLTEAATQINDLTEQSAPGFRQKVQSGKPMFYHLAEGVEGQAVKHFVFLLANGLLARNLIGIHSLDLNAQQFATLAKAGAKVVWSPLSNATLYGNSVNPRHLKDVVFGLGSDWTPSGSRNVLLELKVAKLLSAAAGGPTSRQLVDAVTSQAASVAAWDASLGSLQPGRLADLVVVESRDPDPFENLVRATEKHVDLVIIDGQPRYGNRAVLTTLGVRPDELEAVSVGGVAKALRLHQPGSVLNDLPFSQARQMLRDAMANLSELRSTPQSALARFSTMTDARAAPPLHLDMQDEPHVPLSFFDRVTALFVKKPKLPPLDSIELDPPTIDDAPSAYFDVLEGIPHLPLELRGLRRFYS